jgi:hypothetical protein
MQERSQVAYFRFFRRILRVLVLKDRFDQHRTSAAPGINVSNADKTDLGFFVFVDAASLCTCGGLLAAWQPMSRKRSLLAGFERLIQIALSLHGVWPLKTRDGACFAHAAIADATNPSAFESWSHAKFNSSVGS